MGTQEASHHLLKQLSLSTGSGKHHVSSEPSSVSFVNTRVHPPEKPILGFLILVFLRQEESCLGEPSDIYLNITVLLPIMRYMCLAMSTFLSCPFSPSLSGCFKVSIEICHLIIIPMATSCEETNKHRVKTWVLESSRWKNHSVRERPLFKHKSLQEENEEMRNWLKAA